MDLRFCPYCGKELIFDKLEADVPTDHYHYSCPGGHRWVETMTKDGQLLHISPLGEDDGEAKD